jgi:hypothetical protein
VEAAKRAAAIGRTVAGKHVIFVGTAGIFGPFESCTLMRASDVHWEPTGVRLGLAYTVSGSAPPIDITNLPSCSQILAHLPRCTVVCTPEISLDSTPTKVRSRSPAVENLELYSIVGELAASAKTLDAIMCTTNTVGARSHEQWKMSFKTAAALSSQLILDAIASRSRE